MATADTIREREQVLPLQSSILLSKLPELEAGLVTFTNVPQRRPEGRIFHTFLTLGSRFATVEHVYPHHDGYVVMI